MKKLLLILPFCASAIIASNELDLSFYDLQSLEHRAERLTLEIHDWEREMKGVSPQEIPDFMRGHRELIATALQKVEQEIARREPEQLPSSNQ